MSFSSLYVGATGVKAHGDNMQVVGNNLANVSTIGYKRADGQFTDIMSQQMVTGGAGYDSGAYSFSQIGKGVALGDIRNIMEEGALQNTSTVTDLAITGEGFFGVRKTSGNGGTNGASHYTRAGNFRFNNEAFLVDPHDFRLQGYAIDRETGETSGSVSDIQLPYEDITQDGVTTRWVRSDPKVTSDVEMITTLDAQATDMYTSETSPFFALLEAYDGTKEPTPFGDSLPAYSSSVAVYDEDGNERDMTIYFDPVSTSSISNATPGYTYWEYLVALPADADGSSAFGTSAAGLAGLGVMTFNGNGELVDQSAYSLNLASSAGGKALGAWEAASFSDDGNALVDFTFGEDGAAIGSNQPMSYDFGISSETGTWTNSSAGNAATVGNNTNSLKSLANQNRDVRTSTSFEGGSATLYSNQDGYSWGYLQSTSVTREGVLSGFFTNGQTEEFYQVAIYRFNSEWGLRRDGGNNFVETAASGAAVDAQANEGGRGTVMSNTLESSNVDMAEEFAKMILTQRGYQANTKVITTSDTLINTTISIKK